MKFLKTSPSNRTGSVSPIRFDYQQWKLGEKYIPTRGYSPLFLRLTTTAAFLFPPLVAYTLRDYPPAAFSVAAALFVGLLWVTFSMRRGIAKHEVHERIGYRYAGPLNEKYREFFRTPQAYAEFQHNRALIATAAARFTFFHHQWYDQHKSTLVVNSYDDTPTNILAESYDETLTDMEEIVHKLNVLADIPDAAWNTPGRGDMFIAECGKFHDALTLLENIAGYTKNDF